VGEHGVVVLPEEFLRGVFRCSGGIAQSIGRRAVDHAYPVSTIILKQGDRAATAFLLVTGRAQARNYGVEGQEVLLREFFPGDFFGALVEVEADPELADVVAAEPVRALVFLPVDFLALMDMHACVGAALSRVLMKQLKEASARMVGRTTISSVGRVKAELLRLARQADGRTIRPVPVNATLAVHALCTRETVSRTISALTRRGVVRREPDALVILSAQRLEDEIV
jgi:CRP/FNR family transcriptional regulator, cyclic AMP receptor protein